MEVYGLDLLTKFSVKHANAKAALDSWLFIVEQEVWKTPHDVKARFSSVDFLAKNKVIFNIKGNHYRMIVKIGYNDESVLVEWVGTHAEYSRLTL